MNGYPDDPVIKETFAKISQDPGIQHSVQAANKMFDEVPKMNLLGAIGKKPCEIVLQKVLQELNNRKLVRKVMNIFYDFRDGLRQISYVPDLAYRKRFTYEWHQKFFDKVFNNEFFPMVVKTHLWCVLTAHYREHGKNLSN